MKHIKPRREYKNVIKICSLGNNYRNKLLDFLGWSSCYQDNGYCQGKLTDKNFIKAFELAKQKKVKVFYAHDFKPQFLLDEILREFEIVICPIHNINIIKEFKEFEWFGYDPIDKIRNYTWSSFKRLTENKKRWSMGWRSLKDLTIVHFDGFDTTIPSSLSRFGRVVSLTGETHVFTNSRTTEELICCSIINLDFYLRTLWHEVNNPKNYSFKNFYPYVESET